MQRRVMLCLTFSLAMGAASAMQPRPAAAQTAPAPNPQCARDLFFAEGGLRQSLTALNDKAGAADGVMCGLWRAHVERLKTLDGVYARCKTGSEKARLMADTGAQLQNFQSAVKDRCKGH